MLQLTDGTIMVQSGSSQNWQRLTPDVHGSYINGTWISNPITPMGFPRLYFASHVLPDGRVWILGGEYTGPFQDANIAPSGEIWDPLSNTWSRIAPYPSQPGCGTRTVRSNATLTAGSNVLTGIYSTDRFQVGWTVVGSGIPLGAIVSSVDSTTQVHISQNASISASSVTLTFSGTVAACFGDDPTMLISKDQILAGNIFNRSSYIYSISTDSWTFAGNKAYNDRSDEEGWVRLPGNQVLTYDLFQSVSANAGYAEIFNANTGQWSGISPADGTAHGSLPVLSSSALGFELGPVLRLHDGRIFVIGANNHTALYDPATNFWSPGPDIFGTLSNAFGSNQAPFGADDAPAALLPNGHVLLAADAGPAAVTAVASTTAGSNVITNLPSTAGLQTGWKVAQTNGASNIIPSGATILAIDSPTQIRISTSAVFTSSGLSLNFGGLFSRPTQLFDFNPDASTISPVDPPIPDVFLPSVPAFVTRMLALPTGQILLSNSTGQLWVYTPDGLPDPSLRPVLNDVTYNGAGVFTLTGQQLNGQSAGSAYGDDVESDENYPIVRLVSLTGNVYYCRTTNWSSTGVGRESVPETVNFTLNSSVTPGDYMVVVSGAGNPSFPLALHITQEQVDKQ